MQYTKADIFKKKCLQKRTFGWEFKIATKPGLE